MFTPELWKTVHIYLNILVFLALAENEEGDTTVYNGISVKEMNVKEVDKKICDILKSPTKKDFDQEEKLMKSLQKYYEYLDNINDRIDRRWRQAENVKQMLENVGRAGPHMVHVAINETMFKEAWEWDDDDVDTMSTTILGIRYMWDQVTKRTNYFSS